MKNVKTAPIVCRLKTLRLAMGLTQTQLAEQVGVKRQAIYDMESGRYMPNTAVALRLAECLQCRVEEIFARAEAHPPPALTLMAPAAPDVDTRLDMVRIRGKLVGYPLTGKNVLRESLHAADGLLLKKDGQFRLLQPPSRLDQKALLLGCDPAFDILRDHVVRIGAASELLCRFASSRQALEALSAGHTHIAGTHFHNTDETEANVSFARSLLGEFKGLVIGFSSFEEGLMVAAGNPLGIRTVADLCRADVRLVNREPGAALRTLLEDWLKRKTIPADSIRGFDDLVYSHSQGAQRVLYGTADVALGLRIVARAYGLEFVTLSMVRCDMVIPRDLMDHVAVQVALDVLHSRSFREELSHLPGYDTSSTGKVILRG